MLPRATGKEADYGVCHQQALHEHFKAPLSVEAKVTIFADRPRGW